MSDELGVAVIGPGGAGVAHLRAYRQEPRVRLRAVCARTVDKAARKLAELGLSDVESCDDPIALLSREDVRIVSICTIPSQHVELAIRAAEAGKHIVIERPVAMDRNGLQRVRDAVAANGVRMSVCFEQRFCGLFENMIAMLERRWVGKLFYGEAVYLAGGDMSATQAAWLTRQDHAGSAMIVAGCVPVDALRYLMGWAGGAGEIESVFAYAGRSPENPLGFQYAPNVVVTLRFASGAVGQIGCVLEARTPPALHVRLIGTEGGLSDGRFYSRELPGQRDWAEVPLVAEGRPVGGTRDLLPLIRDFVDAILEDRPHRAELRECIKTHQVCLAVDQSVVTGRPVRVDYF